MKKTKLFGWAFAATMMGASFTACTNEANEVLTQESEIRLTSEITPSSRITNPDYQSTQIVSGQQVGVTITNATSMHNNQPWSAGNNGVLNNIGDKVYWGNGTATITAYHPFNENWTFDGANNFSVSTTQTTNKNYLSSDLLWAAPVEQTKTENAVGLTFAHQLAKINVSLSSSDIPNDDLEKATISICGTKVATTFNPSTGALGEATGDAVEIVAGKNSKTASAIIVPQTVGDKTNLIRVAIEGKIYYYSLSDNYTFEAGHSYTYALNIKNKIIEVSANMNIGEWNDHELSGDANETTETEGKVVHVATPGSLKSLIDENEKLAITSLTVTGSLNGEDIRYIREMAGRDVNGNSTEGRLVNLDISGVSIVADTSTPYLIDGGTEYKTTNDCIGTGMFMNCKLQTIILPQTISEYGDAILYGCANLESVTLSVPLNGLQIGWSCGSETTGGVSFFINNSSNNNAYSIDGVLFAKTTIGYETSNILAAYGKHYETYAIPEGTNYISADAFLLNTYTKSIIIPSSVINIGRCSVGMCTELDELYCYAITPPTTEGGLSPFESVSSNNIYSTCTLYVPEGSIEAYRSAQYWGDFTNIKAIKD